MALCSGALALNFGTGGSIFSERVAPPQRNIQVFKGATSGIECEIKLIFDAIDPEGTVEVEKVKIDNRGSILLDIDDAKTISVKIYPEVDE